MSHYIRITNPLFTESDAAGRPAAGYLVWTLVAGTVDTLTDSFSDIDLTVLNTNPIVLDTRGQYHVFTPGAVKLVYTLPGGDLTSPIWTEDHVGEMQNNNVTGLATPVTVDNNYVVSTVPAVTSLQPNFMLIMIPDVNNTDTVGSAVFTGAGVNDFIPSGAYVGTVAGAIFTFTIDSTVQSAPPAATLAANGTAGLVTAGHHTVKLVALTAGGHTEPGPVSNDINAAGSKQLDVSGIPAVAGEITGYDVYMNKAGGTTWYRVNGATPVTTTTYTINIADATLGTGDYTAAPTDNTTANAGISDTFKWKKDGGAETLAVSITAGVATLSGGEGLKYTWSVLTGHTLGDVWTVTVMTPARVLLDNLPDPVGYPNGLLVYKNEGGAVVPIAGNDLIAGYPALMLLDTYMTYWLLTNPATPIFSTPTITANRYRKNVTADYDMIPTDEGYLLSCIGTFTITLLTCPEFSGKFFYILNAGTGDITVDAGSYTINTTGASTITLPPKMAIQLQSNGVDWEIPSDASPVLTGYDFYTYTAPFSYTWPWGIRYARITRAGGGGGGGMGVGSGAGGSGAFEISIVTPTPGTTDTVTVGAGGLKSNGAPPNQGAAGGASSVGALASSPGGSGGTDAGAGGAPGDVTGNPGETYVATPTIGGVNQIARAYGNFANGGDNNDSGDPGFVLIEWYR